MRIGLLGAGPWAQAAHAPAPSGHKDLDFVGVWSRRFDAAEELADRHGTRAYDDVYALLTAADTGRSHPCDATLALRVTEILATAETLLDSGTTRPGL